MFILLSDDQIRAEWKRLRAEGGSCLGHISVATIEVEPGVTVAAVIEVAPASAREAHDAS